MKMRLVTVLLFITFLAARPATAAATPLINLVGDDASMVIYVTDMPTMVKRWPNTPWMKMWHDDQVQKYFAPFRTQLKIDEWDERCKTDTGYTVAELLDFATGEAVFVLSDLGAVLDAAKNKTEPPLLIAVAISENGPKIEKLITDAEAKDKDAKRTETTEDFDGVTLHIVQTAGKTEAGQLPDIWAIADGIFYTSPSKDFLQQTLSAAKKGGRDNALGKSDGFVEMRHRAGDAQVIYYTNIKGVYPAAQKALADKKQGQTSDRPNPLGLDSTAILPALGLDAVNELYVTASLGEESADLNFGLTYSERRGLTKLISYTDGAPPQPSFVPEKCFAVSSARFSLKNFYDTIEDTLATISPMFSGMFEGYVKSYNQRLGIDIKRDLIGSLGDQLVMGNIINEAAPADAPVNLRFNPFYAISVENAATLTTAMESIKHGLFGESADKFFEKRTYLGHDLYTFSPPQPPMPEGAPPRPPQPGFSYAITDHWLFLGIGSSASVEAALQGLDGKQSSFWDKPEVKHNLLADLPDNACGFSYIDLGKIIPVYFDLVVQGMENSRRMAASRKAAAQANSSEEQPGGGQQQEETSTDADKPFVDPDAKPDAATLAKYWSYSRSYVHQEAGGLYSTAHIAYPK